MANSGHNSGHHFLHFYGWLNLTMLGDASKSFIYPYSLADTSLGLLF
jgi:hypothetical protein